MSKNFKQFSKAIWEKYEVVEEENKPTNPELWARAKSMAKKKFDVYPSAYANGWASKWYKSKGGGWKSVSEAVEPEKKDEYDGEVDMAKNQLKRIISHAQHFHDMLTDKDQNLPEWVQSKVTKAEDYISSAHDYMMGEMQEATYTAVHAKHGTKTVQADSTYGAAKTAASHWNTGKKGTQGIDVHLHTDKPKSYNEETMDEDYKQGQSAFKAGKKYSDNPHPKGSDAHLQWSKGHNQARANKLSEGVAGAVAGGALGAMTGGPIGAIAGGYLGHKVQQAANKKKKNEEADLEEANFQITYKNPQFSKPQTHTIKAKNADHAQTKFLSYGNPYKVHSVKKVNEDTVTYTHKDTGAKMKSKFITDVAAKNFATQLRSQQHKNIEHHKEEADVPALLKKEGYYKDMATNKAEDERLAKQKKTNYPPHMDELLKKARAYDKKHPLPKNEEVTEELKFKGLTSQDKKRMAKMNTAPTKPVMNKPGRQVAKHKDVVVHHHQGVGHVYKNHKHIASGDYDEGAGGYFMSKHGDKKAGQKFFDNEHKVAKHYAESIEESALTRVMNKLKDVETKKSFATGQSRIPTPEERRKQLSKKASVVKEAAKKKKQKPESFEADPELTSDVQIKGS